MICNVAVVRGRHGEVAVVVEVLLLDERQQLDKKTAVALGFASYRNAIEIRDGAARVRVAHRKPVPNVVVSVQGDAELFQIVGALRHAGRLTGRLHRRQQQSNEDADDRDDDQEFNQRETARGPRCRFSCRCNANHDVPLPPEKPIERNTQKRPQTAVPVNTVRAYYDTILPGGQ